MPVFEVLSFKVVCVGAQEPVSVSSVCISRISVQLCFWANLQTGKQQLHPRAWEEAPGLWGTGLGSHSQAAGSWTAAVGGGSDFYHPLKVL